MATTSRTIEYLRWALTVPGTARYDLTASGMDDAADDPAVRDLLGPPLDAPPLARRRRMGELGEALVEALATHYGVPAKAFVPTLGSSLAITQALLGLCQPGDHVIVERPTYEPLWRTPERLGLHTSRLERDLDESWAVLPDRLARLLTPRTRAVLLTNLHNPSGVSIPPKTLTTLADLAARVGAWILVDEVYLDFLPGDGALVQTPSACQARNVVSWSSATKAYGLGALRLGWFMATDETARQGLRDASLFLHVHIPPATSELGLRALACAPALLERARARSDRGLRALGRWLAAEPRVRAVTPAGGLACAVALPAGLDDRVFCEHLRKRYETLVVPGAFFEAPGCVRLGVGAPRETLAQGLANIGAALDDLT